MRECDVNNYSGIEGINWVIWGKWDIWLFMYVFMDVIIEGCYGIWIISVKIKRLMNLRNLGFFLFVFRDDLFFF